MASHQTLTLLLLTTLMLALTLTTITSNAALSTITSSKDCGIGMYWGQNFGEGSIKDECAAGRYKYINIAFLATFGNGTTPDLDLIHCNPDVHGCTYLGTEIQSCQSQGTKVFLSLGGPNGSYTLTSTEDAQQVADYLWNNFLGGSSSSRPFQNAVLDGIDFYIKHGTTQHWDELAQILSNYGEQAGKKVYLSAAPQSQYPDYYLGKAIATEIFDYVWVLYYTNPVQLRYTSDNAANLICTWYPWTTSGINTTFLMGLPAAPEAAGSGYLSPDVFNSEVQPVISRSSKYGGIMLWGVYYDPKYSSNVTPCLGVGQSYGCKCTV